MYADLRDFARHGLSSLSRPRTVGAPPSLSREQIATIRRVAGQPPTALGLPFGRWSLAKLRDVPHPTAGRRGDQPRAPPPGAEKGGYTLRRIERKLLSDDPNRPVILHRLRSWWRHRPRGAILAFFDIQPITVKAYGGRCYTTAKRLVLQRNQKTRGRFYLLPALRGEPWSRPLGLLPRQGGRVCVPFPAENPPVVSRSAGADRLGSRSGAPDQGPDDPLTHHFHEASMPGGGPARDGA